MYLFWRKNRLKVRSIRRLKEKENEKYVYLPVSVLLKALNDISEKYPNLFKYEVKLYTDFVPGYEEGASILLYYRDKKLFNYIVNKLVIDYCGKYEFTFDCGCIEWKTL